jgi:hypothetical protein
MNILNTCSVLLRVLSPSHASASSLLILSLTRRRLVSLLMGSQSHLCLLVLCTVCLCSPCPLSSRTRPVAPSPVAPHQLPLPSPPLTTSEIIQIEVSSDKAEKQRERLGSSGKYPSTALVFCTSSPSESSSHLIQGLKVCSLLLLMELLGITLALSSYKCDLFNPSSTHALF